MRSTSDFGPSPGVVESYSFSVRQYYWSSFEGEWSWQPTSTVSVGSEYNLEYATEGRSAGYYVQFVFTLAGNYSLEGDTATVGEGTQSNPYKIK